jgi:hypothetical protein
MLAASVEPSFEADAARLAIRALADEPPWRLEVVDLAAGTLAEAA